MKVLDKRARRNGPPRYRRHDGHYRTVSRVVRAFGIPRRIIGPIPPLTEQAMAEAVEAARMLSLPMLAAQQGFDRMWRDEDEDTTERAPLR